MCPSFLILCLFVCFGLFDLSKDELEVDLDGKIIFLDESRKIQWSFASGGPICSSYQALGNNDKDKSNASGLNANDFYIDCGDDLSLYLYRKSFGKVVRKLALSKSFKRFNCRS